MSKIIKKIICLSLIFIITGCTKSNQQTTQYPFFTIQLFYLDDCGSCNAFKNNALPAIREAFNNNFNIEYYNLDLEENEQRYIQITEQLENYDEEYMLNTPFIVVDNKFAVVGYSKNEKTELIKEIKRALNNEPLGDYYKIGRYTFKGETS